MAYNVCGSCGQEIAWQHRNICPRCLRRMDPFDRSLLIGEEELARSRWVDRLCDPDRPRSRPRDEVVVIYHRTQASALASVAGTDRDGIAVCEPDLAACG